MEESATTILVVDDEAIARDNVAYVLKKEGYHVLTADDGEKAISLLEQKEVDLVLTDLRMKKRDGMEVLDAAKKIWPDTEVVVITGYATVDTAVEAMRKGAYYYLAKPVKMDEMLALVQKALEKRGLRREVSELRRKIADKTGVLKIIGQSPKTRLLRETISQVAQLDCNVLIQGETGTGKELVARTIHELSPRRKKRFVAFNCGVFSGELIASELFGHEKGAFTGASQVKKGLLELAEGGTVFFDEVGELSLPMQVKLLRVIQERTLMRVGGTEEIKIDIRILAATNKDLKREAEEGAFRSDLFYRLDVLTIRVPPLGERREDIPLLANHFLKKHAPPDSVVPKLSREVVQYLQQYEYPGNVRELENVAQRLLLQADGCSVIEADHLVEDLQQNEITPSRMVAKTWPSLEEQEKNYILEVLDEVEGNKSKAARILDIDRVSLWRKIKRYGLDRPEDD
ncbi:sigma-54-dependent transcriptional regulator [Desulforhopalus singaporensis]|uniref:DNA-binding transcriptional response regulator, NtrC family, contains REC, AAA-type ATPase, and a Fis-type DNA-binding domains n=1 Tax=Desulforhopalus singaporensis TaxID=91360 RepID=A0A1H0L7W7_9BACT|nr:sigma-54 dependent transcriptional regulator [Desulforhopalus singaporensis]SDO64093.1 DNA-binding transcriptional response regulator, NtrC family, contains REC, AAA-type ATPase, and a Fis-type DNA-binding domains [Desulforhopalus singaporensis]